MDLNQMLIFERVCSNESFTAAAQELGIKKSNVSMKISALEERLGVKLLNRTTRRLSLTEAGLSYYQHCKEILSKIEEAEDKVRDVSTEPYGVLRVAMPMDFGLYCIKHFLSNFSQKYPGLIVDLKLSHQSVNPNEQGIDLVIRPSTDPLDDSELVAKKIFDSNLFLYGSQSYIKNHTKKKNKSPSLPYEYIQFDPIGSSSFSGLTLERTRALFGKWKELEIVKKETKFVFSDMYACMEACKANLGIAVLPSWLINEEVKQKEIIPLSRDIYQDKVTFYALYSSKKWLPKKTQIFLEELKVHCADFS